MSEEAGADQPRIAYPPDLVAEWIALGDECLTALESNYIEARTKALELLESMRKAETPHATTYHKGAALHNVGVATIWSNSDAALMWFVAAFIEDVRTYRGGAWEAPAAQALLHLYRVPLDRLEDVEVRAAEVTGIEPTKLATTLLSAGDVSALEPNFLQKATLKDLPPPKRAVFVGGSYKGHWSNIASTAQGVRYGGMVGVVVRSFDDAGWSDEREKSFGLLDQCSLAVFDVTPGGNCGWQHEMARLEGRDCPILAVYDTTSIEHAYDWPPMLGSQSRYKDLTIVGFASPEDQRARVAEWVSAHVPIDAKAGPLMVPRDDGSKDQAYSAGSNWSDVTASGIKSPIEPDPDHG
jgi:hypothetical protein